LRRGLTGPPWTGSRRERRAHRSSTGRLVPREALHREWGKGERRPSGSSPEADGGGATIAELRRRRAEAAVRGARWEGNTGADGARTGTVVWRRCSRVAFMGRGTTEGGRSRSNRRRLGGASMAKPFRVGEEMGRGNRESGRGTEQRRRFVLPWEKKGCYTGERSRRWRPVGLPEEEDSRAQ
jgi:hypothetical protein